jgi:cellulose biosynthesis protein BcsQ
MGSLPRRCRGIGLADPGPGHHRQPALHTPFARHFRAFLAAVHDAFDVCVVDTNPNPDIRLIAALASADFVLSPIQLNQEAMDGVSGLLNHDRVGLRKIKACLEQPFALVVAQESNDGIIFGSCAQQSRQLIQREVRVVLNTVRLTERRS